ncbi:MAG: hypothetical protein A3K60_05340 [Euryarchaeota archaeon RBG_19FT_COMBO_56_21]|nr:MAG: hypothetical protein A3K60_05340 [Euryarchaeota archaeon RBG_19FT_COMBO_56_21]
MAESKLKGIRIPRKYRGVLLFLRDAGIAFLFVCLVLLTMFAYTGMWPPLVVVESNSMMHGEDNLSDIGTIDTGDLVLVKKVDQASDIETYLEGYVSGYRSYGDYGDVIVYERGGVSAATPIIHRAMMYLEINPDNSGYKCAALKNVPQTKWSTLNTADTWDNLTSVLIIHDVGWGGQSVTIDIRAMTTSDRSGFITKGDHNSAIDQMYGAAGPVNVDWVVGKARGEIPWFGLLKLWSTDTLGSPAPPNSVRNLWITIAMIVIAPVVMDIVLTHREKKRIERRRALYAANTEDRSKVEKRVEGEEQKDPPSRP